MCRAFSHGFPRTYPTRFEEGLCVHDLPCVPPVQLTVSAGTTVPTSSVKTPPLVIFQSLHPANQEDFELLRDTRECCVPLLWQAAWSITGHYSP